jgi:hypothetical protein
MSFAYKGAAALCIAFQIVFDADGAIRTLAGRILASYMRKTPVNPGSFAGRFCIKPDVIIWAVQRPSNYEAYEVGDMGFSNDDLSSVRINADGVSVTLYYDHRFGGDSVTLSEKGLYNLKDYGFDDRTSSYKIETPNAPRVNPNAVQEMPQVRQIPRPYGQELLHRLRRGSSRRDASLTARTPRSADLLRQVEDDWEAAKGR